MYHSHFMAEHQVPMGLLGAFVVTDPANANPDLATDVDYAMILNDGPLGFTINGKGFPATEPLVLKQGQTIRIRYMNEGLQIHPMHLHGIPQLVVAKDGWDLPTPHFEDTVLVAPGRAGRRHRRGDRAGGVGLPLPRAHARRGSRRDVRHGHGHDRGGVNGRSRRPHPHRRRLRPPGGLRAAARGPDAVAALLERGVAGWEERPGLDGVRRYAVDLRLRLGGPGAALSTFRKAALVDIGAIHRGTAAHEVEIQWRAATAAPLFPVFSGLLRIGPDDLSISGLYAPPGGAVGRSRTARCSTWRRPEPRAGCSARSSARRWRPAPEGFVYCDWSPRRCLATKAAACVRRWRLSFDRMLLT
jgi:hypothetical protein